MPCRSGSSASACHAAKALLFLQLRTLASFRNCCRMESHPTLERFLCRPVARRDLIQGHWGHRQARLVRQVLLAATSAVLSCRSPKAVIASADHATSTPTSLSLRTRRFLVGKMPCWELVSSFSIFST